MRIVVLAGIALAASAIGAVAQTSMDHMQMDHATMAQPNALTQPGQSAFGAIQEVVERLEADPNTDWSKVHIDRLRDHLIDMDEVTLHAIITEAPISGGVRYTVTGSGRTRDAIQHMVIGHATSMGDAEHWNMSAIAAPTGAVVTVLAKRSGDLARIQALGLLGMMADGAHHQVHHWYLATGEGPMSH